MMTVEAQGKREHAPLLDAALSYAAAGYSVFPCRGKIPLTARGVLDAIVDVSQFQQWWRTDPDANIGLRLGRISGLFVIDVDYHPDKDVDGPATLRHLESQLGMLPDGPRQLTTTGGFHLPFKYPEEVTISNSVGKLGPGIDIRSDNAYIIVAPSIHPETGAPYQWEIDHALDEIPLPQLPPTWTAALAALTNGSSNGNSARSHAEAADEPISEGKRNDTLFRSGCAMRTRGMSPAAILAALIAENAARCIPPLPEDEVRLIAKSACSYEAGSDPSGWERFQEKARNRDASGAESAPEEDKEKTKPWPILAEDALYSLAGDIVRAIEPHTEGDPVAVLVNTLAAFGSCISRAAHAAVGKDKHPGSLFALLVGETAKGRKGTAWSIPRYLYSLADEAWAKNCVKSGLSSAEGLIYSVRDATYRKQPIKEKGCVVDYENVLVEEAVEDKRLLIVESEFASTLTVMNREGNTLSTVIRDAWDRGDLATLTRNAPLKATNAHVSLLGHITKQELLVRLDETSKADGFANRFLFALVRRSKELSEGGSVPEEQLQALAVRLQHVITFSRTVSLVQRDEQAKALWASIYHDVSEGKPGLIGSIIARAEAHVLRLSLLYALLDKSTLIRVEHLKAALALREYCEKSAILIFGEKLGDPTADRILEAIRNAGDEGMSDNDIYELFGKNKSANERARAINLLGSLGLIRIEKQETGGRPRTVYRAT